jgi:hypothetical protein
MDESDGVTVRSLARYWKQVLHAAFLETLSDLKSRTKEAVLTAAGGVIGLSGGLIRGEALTALLGGLGGAVCAWLLVFLWRVIALPARLQTRSQAAQANSEARIADLEAESRAIKSPPPSAKERAAETYLALRKAQMRLPGLSTPPVAPEEERERWREFAASLDTYSAAYNELDSIARVAHDRIWALLRSGSQTRDLGPIASGMNQLTDILFDGEFDLNIAIADLTAIPFTCEGVRNQFAIVVLCVTNRESEPVSLLPNWCLPFLEDFQGMLTLDPDAIPLQAWESKKSSVSRLPGHSWLDVPLNLDPRKSAIGYWAFHVPDLESRLFDPLRFGDGHEPEAFLDIRDMASGKRARSEARRFKISHWLSQKQQS